MGIAKDEKEGREGFTEWREGGGVARGSKKKSRRWGNQDNTSIGTLVVREVGVVRYSLTC